MLPLGRFQFFFHFFNELQVPHAAAAAEIHVAAQEGRDRQRAGDDDGFVVQRFLAEETFRVGDVTGEIVEVSLGNGSTDFLGAGGARRECQNDDS